MVDFIAGRYEAGVATLNRQKKANKETYPFDDSVTFSGGVSLFNSVMYETGIISSWRGQNYNFIARKVGTPVTTGTNKATGNVVIKADSIPYNYTDYYTAVEMSERLYREHAYVKSGLVTGTMWDMMMKYMKETGNVDIASSNWGNYDNVSLTNLTGYYTNVKIITSNRNDKVTEGFKNAETLTTNSGIDSQVILTTGSTEQVKKMNLYDVAGNLWEWTQETAYHPSLTYGNNSNNNTYILRGGSFVDKYAENPVVFRTLSYGPSTGCMCGFRVALYI